jgi:CHASE1-domain containing sensor protein
MSVLTDDAHRLKASRFVKRIQEGRKKSFVARCGILIYLECRIFRKLNDAALLMIHRLLLGFLALAATLATMIP